MYAITVAPVLNHNPRCDETSDHIAGIGASHLPLGLPQSGLPSRDQLVGLAAHCIL